MIRIIRAEDDVTDDVREIEKACLRGREHEADPVDLDTYNPEVWLAYEPPASEPIGFGVLVYRPLSDPWPGWYLRMTGTLPEHQGRGIQTRMIRARLAYARAHGATRVDTYTRPDNAESMRGLIRCGFKPYRPREPYAGESLVYWRKRLAK